MMIVKVTKNESISSVHIGSIKNPITLYNLLLTMLGEEAKIFTKPTLKKASNEIEWSSELEGKKLSYSDANEETKQLIKSLLKKKVHKILENKEQTQIELLKKSLEIPDESDIYLIGDEVVLSNWGHIKNAYNARSGIVFDLIGDSATLLKVKVLVDGVAKSGCRVILSWSDGEIEDVSNEDGEIKRVVPINTNIKITVECNGQRLEKSIFTKEPNEYEEINFITKTPPPPKKFKWWWLILLLLLLLLGLLGYFLMSKTPVQPTPPSPKPKKETPIPPKVVKKDVEITISWAKEEGDFDLHLIDSCSNIVDNFRKSATCKDKTIKFIKQSQGFDCQGEICKEKIIAPDGLAQKVKVVINQYSSKKTPAKVKLTIKKGGEVKVEKSFTITTPHPMLKKVNPNSSDIVFEWEDSN